MELNICFCIAPRFRGRFTIVLFLPCTFLPSPAILAKVSFLSSISAAAEFSEKQKSRELTSRYKN